MGEKVRTNYKTAEELYNLDSFFTAQCNSDLKRCLTKEIWEEYKDQSCDAGVSFKTCIFSGVANQDSGIGMYAGSHQAYTKFNKLFDQVVQNYHKHGPNDKHVSNMNAEELQNDDFSQDQQNMVNSTRIRVGRNFADYPFAPGVTKEQRLEIMNKVAEACNNLDYDLKGKFYPLETMSHEVQKQLIEDHFLFK